MILPPLPAFAKQFSSARFSYVAAANLQFARFEDIAKLLSENYQHCPRLRDQSLAEIGEL